MGSEKTDVRYEVRDSAAWLTIDREERRNALRAQTIEGLKNGLCQAGGEDSVRVVCITGAGSRAFCAGADLSAAESGKNLGLENYASLLRLMNEFEKPLIARVAGHCVGGGMGLMMACDVVYAADDITIGTPEVNVGLFPMMVTAFLPRGASQKKVLEMVFTGNLINAQEAERIGLITRYYPRNKLDDAVQTLVETISAKAPLAVSWGRKSWVATEGMPLNTALDYLCRQLASLMATEDAAEGFRAFKEKRQPNWKGK